MNLTANKITVVRSLISAQVLLTIFAIAIAISPISGASNTASTPADISSEDATGVIAIAAFVVILVIGWGATLAGLWRMRTWACWSYTALTYLFIFPLPVVLAPYLDGATESIAERMCSDLDMLTTGALLLVLWAWPADEMLRSSSQPTSPLS